MSDQFATRVYVVGEVLISLLALSVGAFMVIYSSALGPQMVGSGLVSAVTVFWFQRRSSEQANNAVITLANGKLSSLMEAQQQTAMRQQALLDLFKEKPPNP